MLSSSSRFRFPALKAFLRRDQNTQKRLLAEVKLKHKIQSIFVSFWFCFQTRNFLTCVFLRTGRTRDEWEIGQKRHVNGYKNVAVYNLLSVDQMVHVCCSIRTAEIFFSFRSLTRQRSVKSSTVYGKNENKVSKRLFMKVFLFPSKCDGNFFGLVPLKRILIFIFMFRSPILFFAIFVPFNVLTKLVFWQYFVHLFSSQADVLLLPSVGI